MKQTRRNFIKSSALGVITTMAGRQCLATEKSTATTSREQGNYHFVRNIPIDKEYDVIIAGGGPAGIGAALSAARSGYNVLIIEAMGCLGGMGTSGLVTAFDPMANGEEMLVGGIMYEIVMKMYKRGFLGPDEKPEIFTNL